MRAFGRLLPAAVASAALQLASTPATASVSKAWLDARAALTSCLATRDAPARGACLETAAAAMDAAEARGEGPFPSPEQARKSAAREFGLRNPPPPPRPTSAPALREAATPNRLQTRLASVRQSEDGNWIMTTVEGAVWAQTDKSPVARPPHEGSTLTARPGALGSYFCLIDGRREVRCKRRG